MHTNLTILIGLGLLIFTYFYLLRTWQMRWGATDEEVYRAMLGDDLVPHPTFNATRAMTIDAPPREIWPWLVQMGSKRAGWYSYDWIDNLGRPSAKTILPEFQDLKVGDVIPITSLFNKGYVVKELVPNERMLWWNEKDEVSWLWELVSDGLGKTRLLARVRRNYHWFSLGFVYNVLLDFGDIVMMRKCLLGIKSRAEIYSRSPVRNTRTTPQKSNM